MGIGRDIREHLLDRDLHKEIREENAEYINRKSYLRDMDNKKITSKNNRYGNQEIKTK